MRRVLKMTAAVLAAVFFFVLVTLPPHPIAVDVAGADPDLVRRTVAGAYHIHTTRSDGAEGKRAVASAARRAGLRFAIFTDHGDGTRTPDPPEYVDGVLCLDGVEISTNGGHYVALDMPAAPYPLGGEASAVVEDVARLGGFGIAAHPDSLKRELAWTDWHAPIDGIEWLSSDSEWRDESTLRLARALIDYLLRPAPAIASILDRPRATLQRWDALLAHAPVVALAAVDAHGGVRSREEGRGPIGAGPSYDASFRTLSNRVVLERAFSGDAAADARLLMAAIRRGRIYTVIDALATPALFDFEPASPAWVLPPDARVQQMPAGASTRYEVHLGTSPGNPPVPWVVTNPLALPARRAAQAAVPAASVMVTGNWHIEKDPASAAELAPGGGGAMTVRYRLGSGPRANQFAALAVNLSGEDAAHIVFDGHSTAPMRLSVQLKFPGGDERWTKSVYLDSRRRTVAVPVADMVPADGSRRAMPAVTSAIALLFVVDLTNASPGTAGQFTVGDPGFTTASARSPEAPR